jgi:hypothetical protein
MHYSDIYIYWDTVDGCAYIMSLPHRTSSHSLPQMAAVYSKLYSVKAKWCHIIHCSDKVETVMFIGVSRITRFFFKFHPNRKVDLMIRILEQ